jgi:hypothetical protein
MGMALLFLQLVNAAFAAASLWIHFRAPLLWDDQAIAFTACAGALAVCVTALLLGLILLLGTETKWGSILLNLVLVLGFAGLQGYFLYSTGRDLGILHLLKARLGGG